MRHDRTAQIRGFTLRAVVRSLMFLGIGWSHAVSAQIDLAPKPTFDVVSIRQYVEPTTVPGGPPVRRALQCQYFQDRVDCELTVLELIQDAFQLKAIQVKGPTSITSRIFILNATMPPDTSKDTARMMLQSALTDRFHLKFHYETQGVSVYAIVPGKKGVTLQAAADAAAREKDKIATGDTSVKDLSEFSNGSSLAQALPLIQGKRARVSSLFAPGHVYSTAMSLDLLAENMSFYFDRPVVNTSGLNGEYKFDIRWSPDENGKFSSQPLSDPGFLSALEEQGGLRLDRRTVSMNMLVIDHVDAVPTEN
jgi:uncharacterized protein (TIGR03435 family)